MGTGRLHCGDHPNDNLNQALWCNLLRVVCSHKRNIAVARNGKRIHHPVATMSYWGKPSTPMNECEPDYENSPYVAEFWSALGDLVILAIAARGLVSESVRIDALMQAGSLARTQRTVWLDRLIILDRLLP